MPKCHPNDTKSGTPEDSRTVHGTNTQIKLKYQSTYTKKDLKMHVTGVPRDVVTMGGPSFAIRAHMNETSACFLTCAVTS